MNYLKKLFLKKTYTVLSIWRAELIATTLLLLVAGALDVWIYHIMVSRGVEVSEEKTGIVEALQKQIITGVTATISEHEHKLNNPSFPLLKNPF